METKKDKIIAKSTKTINDCKSQIEVIEREIRDLEQSIEKLVKIRMNKANLLIRLKESITSAEARIKEWSEE